MADLRKDPLPVGYHPLPPGHLANVVTCLEMTARPALRPAPEQGFTLARMGAADTGRFRNLFRAIGQDIMWFSRLMLEEEALAAIIGDADVQCFALVKDGHDVGLLELDFREDGQCELSFFGVVPSAVGGGAGRFLMNEALTRAWAQPITRMWVHTCHFDHPAALGFYQRSGFRPYAVMVEVHPDPRLTGQMPKHASPQVPLIGG
ncbi:GNAT family N-acetyltransferase [Aestuariivirga litoralis]|uniref:GNAT family N-acetyltransferase n=1 Tax=Aestuariivirga litoralis TaxID=2650924 RepID=A0A2W2AS21_9HYPH|nr:GNAT family N-acetyltransferase [Aestuariivirga litoralis]PZF75290.1 GNAT family N-acetyltransferase [Aestuariivirga litoralis]